MTAVTTSRRRLNGTSYRTAAASAVVFTLCLFLTGHTGAAKAAEDVQGNRGANVAPVAAEDTAVEALPATLQLAMTRRLACEAPAAYHIDAEGRGVNARHALTLAFTAEGAQVDGRDGGFALRLARIGRGAGEVVRSAAPRIDGAWVEYDRGSGVREWFVNLPRGLEQGWTLGRRPAGQGPLTLTLDTGRPADTANDGRLVWSGVVYHSLVALDAEGRTLPARWTTDGAHLHIDVDDDAAVYPVVIDPWVQQEKLTADQGAAEDSFGWSVALSDDGNTALVGAVGTDVDGNDQGVAYVFTLADDGTWSELQTLTASFPRAFEAFGTSVALSGEGDTALVGAPYAAGSQGVAYLFTRSDDGIWSQAQILLAGADGASGYAFGWSVALSDDGDTALVGHVAAEVGQNETQGAAYVFTRSNSGAWTKTQMLTASDGALGDSFGTSVALSSEGDTALVGADGDTSGRYGNPGAAYVFTRSNNGPWTEAQKLTPGDRARDDYFGKSVALSGNGDTALVGADGTIVAGTANEGAAYVFTRRTNGTWNDPQQFTPGDDAVGDLFGNSFGGSVALSEDGITVLVGARRADVGDNADQGVAYVFSRGAGGTWSDPQLLTADDAAAGDGLGASVALSDAADTALVGAWSADVGENANQGAAYVFQFQGDTAAPTTTITLDPATPNRGWYTTSPVQVTVSATDDVGVVAQIRCALDPTEAPVSFADLPNEECTFTTPGDVADDGDHTLYAASVDEAGNASDVVSAPILIDQTPPTVTCVTRAPVFAFGGADARVRAEVTDETSGPAETPISAAADTRTPGEKTVMLTGVDVAGHQTAVPCPYTVMAPPVTITGTVIDEDEAPVAGVTVTLSGTTQAEVITGDDGAFAFTDLTWGGRYTVTPTHPDYDVQPASRRFDPLDADQEVTFTATTLTATYTRYFGEGAIGPFFDTTFALFNPTDEEASATLSFAGEASEVVPHSVTIPAGTQVIVDPEALLPATWVGFATAIEADQTLVTSRTMRWDDRHYGRHESAGVATPQSEWWLTEGATGTFQLFYLLYNPGDAAAEVTATYYRGGEQPPVPRTYTVAPHTRRTVFVNVAADGVTPDPALGNTEVSAHIVSTNGVPIVAERALYLTTNAAQPLTAGTIAAAVTEPTTSWHFAEGATAFFDLFLLLANPSPDPVEATVRYLLPTGDPLERTYTLGPESRRTIWVDQEDAALAETQVAISVQSDAPILAERAMWWGANGAWDGGHVSTGATRPATRWGLAGVTLGGPDTAEGYVLIANPNAAETQATLTLITPDGARAPVVVPLGPWSRTTLRLADVFPDAGDAPVAVLVESTGGENPVPLVVEGAAYASPEGRALTTGSATPALPVPEPAQDNHSVKERQ